MAQRLPAEERRRQILRAAARVFARRGYHGATTRAISEEAGVAEALLYRHFPSKLEMFTAAIELTSTRLVTGLAAALDAHPRDPVAALSATLSFYRAMLEKNQDLAKMVFLVGAELDNPTVRETYGAHQERALELLSDAVERWRDEGLVRASVEPRGAAWIILGSYQLLALMKQTGKLSDLTELPIEQLVGSILA